MATTQKPTEDGQLAQTIEMFEVITQSDPQDYQSLEILKEAYSKMGREKDVARTSKRIAQAYVQMGQISSAILEYETVLQRYPDDPDVHNALKQIEGRANSAPIEPPPEPPAPKKTGDTLRLQRPNQPRPPAGDLDDGRRMMHKLFVDSKLIAPGDFDLCWPASVGASNGGEAATPFIQLLSEKGILPVEKSLKLLCEKSRAAYLPLQLYDVDMDLARSFPAETCRRWCVMPFDRMSKSIMVATANPFNQQAAKELAAATPNRLLWYLVPPTELVNFVRKAFR